MLSTSSTFVKHFSLYYLIVSVDYTVFSLLILTQQVHFFKSFVTHLTIDVIKQKKLLSDFDFDDIGVEDMRMIDSA